MTVREQINADLSVLSEAELRQVANYLASLKLQAKKNNKSKNGKRRDPLFNLGKNPVETGISDASENLDKYIY